MRVLHAYKIYRPDSEGGIPEILSCLTKDVPKDIDCSIYVTRQLGLARKYEIDKVPVSASGSFGSLFSMPLAPAYPGALASRSHQVDLIVHHAPFPLTDLASLRFARQVAFVIHWHAEIHNRRLLKSLLSPAIHHALRRANKIIVSHPVIVEQSEFLQNYKAKCIAVPYGTDFQYWDTRPSSDRPIVERLQQQYPRMIVAVGRLVEYKGYSLLLHALKGLDAQLVIIGEGPLSSELRRLADQLSISDRVVFAGRLERDGIRQYLHAAKVMALSSLNQAEAFGLVQIEAMAAGLPVVNTNLPSAVPTVARHEIEGLTVAPDNVDALQIALHRVLENSSLAASLGAAGRARAASEYGLELFRTRSFEIYREAVKHQRSQIR